MNKELNATVVKYEKKHRRQSLWHRILTILSALTVFVTTYAMILPAITMEPSPGIKLQDTFVYESEDVIISFYVDGRAVFQDVEKTPAELKPENVTMQVQILPESSSVYRQYEAYAVDSIGVQDLRSLMAVNLSFTYDGNPLNMDHCEISAMVIAKDSMIRQDRTETENLAPQSVRRTEGFNLAADPNVILDPETPEGEVIALTAIQGIGRDLSQQPTGYMTGADETLSVLTQLTGSTMALAAYSTVNPAFTVQYYAHRTVFTEGDVAISIIDTSGANLPDNGTANPMVDAYLNSVGGGKYEMATEEILSELYGSRSYYYVEAPGVPYVNRLIENGNYVLDEVWVLKAGRSATSTDPSHWDIYDPAVSFTNRENSASSSRIFIDDGTVIRLVYREIDGTYTNAVDFYDYDITDGDIHDYYGNGYSTNNQTNGVWYAQTQQQGINNYTAPSGTVKLAFGNSNTGSGLAALTWNSNTLNQYNRRSTLGCTFGLVTGFNEDGSLIYADGVAGPQLFGDAVAAGKTKLEGYSLQFNRHGDTYVLTGVNGTSTTGLNYFNNPSYYNSSGSFVNHTHIYTNNFWPMDSSNTWGTAGHDLKFGSAIYEDNRKFFSTPSNFISERNNTSADRTFPVSDDGVDHNSYFGMYYEIIFTLSEDYKGALEYIFYGDDDMWVFLDDTLVCDIGGIHSSVGQYVNLWDYINAMPANERYAQHTLRFYYTERGASGSTCYMQFTVPSISVDTPQVESNTLELGKQVINGHSDTGFLFDILLLDENGDPLVDDYSYTIYAPDGSIVTTDLINFDERTVELAHGYRLRIQYLPEGTRFRITEHGYDGYHTTYSINGGTPAEGTVASGAVWDDVNVLFINSTGVVLPSTGGSGWFLYMIPLMAAGIMAVIMPWIFRFTGRAGDCRRNE